jgi:hypothetical protein
MLAPELLTPIAVFALLESGCTEVWLYKNGSLIGVEAEDGKEALTLAANLGHTPLVRTFGYRGTAGDRNLHRMTGRVE